MTSVERFVTVKLREWNSAGGTSGCDTRRIHHGNSAVATAPMARAANATGLRHARC